MCIFTSTCIDDISLCMDFICIYMLKSTNSYPYIDFYSNITGFILVVSISISEFSFLGCEKPGFHNTHLVHAPLRN